MPRPLPVTLVAGFLGAGKTSLLHHLVSGHQGGHLALLVEKSAELNPDARVLRGLCGAMGRLNDVVLEVGDAEQLAATLHEIAARGVHERVVMEVGALTLTSYWERAIASVPELARLEQVVVVVDALGGSPESEAFRSAQVRGAGLIVLNKCDLIDEAQRREAGRRWRELNPTARLAEVAYGEVSPDDVFRAMSALPACGANADLPPHEIVVYRAQRPFHPQRFWTWFNAPHPGLERVKGIVWLATRNLLVGGVSRAGRQNSCGAAGIWWVALPREEWPLEPERLREMQATWREPYGDRRQELVLTGRQGPTSDAARKLNLCLLSDTEVAAYDEWRGMPDPFPEWDVEG